MQMIGIAQEGMGRWGLKVAPWPQLHDWAKEKETLAWSRQGGGPPECHLDGSTDHKQWCSNPSHDASLEGLSLWFLSMAIDTAWWTLNRLPGKIPFKKRPSSIWTLCYTAFLIFWIHLNRFSYRTTLPLLVTSVVVGKCLALLI